MKFEKIITKYLYLKMCWETAFAHLIIPSNLIEKAAIAAVFLKIFNINNYYLIGIGMAVSIIIVIVFGHWIYTHGIKEKEITMQNKFNKELMSIYKETGGKDECKNK